MDQDTKPAPFNLGDHVVYTGSERRELAADHGSETELVLAPGMEGVIVLSTGMFSIQGEAAPKPWHCMVQFENGFQLDITPETFANFRVASNEAALPAS